MNSVLKFVVIAPSLLMAACSSAPKSSEVSAAYVSSIQYSNFTCEQLINEAEGIRKSTPALEAAVDSHRSGQTGVEVVSWILFWPAAFALDKGREYSEPLAKAKGELQAIQAVLLTKNCKGLLVNKDIERTEIVPPQSQPTKVSGADSSGKSLETSAASKLRDLDQLYKEGLLTEQEFKIKRQQLIDKL